MELLRTLRVESRLQVLMQTPFEEHHSPSQVPLVPKPLSLDSHHAQAEHRQLKQTDYVDSSSAKRHSVVKAVPKDEREVLSQRGKTKAQLRRDAEVGLVNQSRVDRNKRDEVDHAPEELGLDLLKHF